MGLAGTLESPLAAGPPCTWMSQDRSPASLTCSGPWGWVQQSITLALAPWRGGGLLPGPALTPEQLRQQVVVLVLD